MRQRLGKSKKDRQAAPSAATKKAQVPPNADGMPRQAASTKDDDPKLGQLLRRLIDLNHELDLTAVLEDETPE